MSHRRAALALLLLLLSPSLLAEPQVLQKRPGTPGASWDSLDFADLTARPTTLDGYGITDALQGERPVVQTLLYLSDTALVTPQDATLFYPSYGDLAGMVCDVMTAPVGADITLDLRVGDPLTSVYAPGTAPRIVAGDTTTLTGTPEMLAEPVALAPRTKVQVRVLSAPDQNLDGTVGLVADLSLMAPAGMRVLVLADGHVWTRAPYDVVAWTDTGLPAGGAWLGAVATVAALPTATASGSEIWLVTDTARLWQMTNQVDGHVADQASLPAADSVANGVVYVTTDLSQAWQSDGVATWILLGAAWSDLGQAWLPDLAFTAIATSAYLPTAALSGVWYLALDTGHLWRNDAPPWLDSGLLTTFAGAGLRCGLYIYPKVAP